MNITVRYEIDAKAMANASFIYSEKKPMVLYGVGLINIFAYLLAGIMLLKWILIGATFQELIVLLLMCLWLFGRKPLTRAVFRSKMKKINTIGKTIVIELTRNGVAWQGEGIKQGHLAWQHISYILALKNGYIIPYSLNRFLWLPHTGFKSKLQIEKIKTLIEDKHVPLREYPKLGC